MSSGFALHVTRMCFLFFIIMFIEVSKNIFFSFHTNIYELSIDFYFLILIDSSSLIPAVQVDYAIKGS